jgi:UDP-glucose:(heptosyl)LPS alpha-1,3-glucosyltransferase
MKKKRENRLNIAVLVKRFITSGGSERYALEVARKLRDKGHAVDLYARAFDKELSGGMNLYRVPDKFSFSSVLSLLSFAFDTARMLNQKKYDIIHSHERGYRQDISTIHTFSYKGSVQRYSCLRKIDQVYLSPRSGVHLWLERKQMDTPWLAAVSEVVKGDTQTHYHRRNNISVISPGVDTDWFHHSWVSENREKARQAEKITSDEMVVLFVGSEFQRKGLDDLIPAIGSGMRLLIVGKGEREGHYRRLVSKCKVTDRVAFKGHSDDVRRYFASADVVVLPSVSDAFGMSILEGMACSLPVVTSAHTGVSSLIEQGVNGFSFSDPADLPGILKRLLDPDKRKRIGSQGRKTAENHTWDTVAEKYEKLYYQVKDKKKEEQNALT